MRDQNWMKFEASGRVSDYLAYCQGRNSSNWDRDTRNEDEDVDESELYPDWDGDKLHARG